MKHITRLRVHIANTSVGELGTDARGRIYFQYDPTWLKTGFDLSPGTLPFQAEPQLSPEPQEFGGLHGVYGWELSPAFDLTFSSGINNQHTTDIAGNGNPHLKDIQRVAASCGIKRWREMLEQVRSATRQWQAIAAQEGVSGEESQKIGNALAEIEGRLG